MREEGFMSEFSQAAAAQPSQAAGGEPGGGSGPAAGQGAAAPQGTVPTAPQRAVPGPAGVKQAAQQQAQGQTLPQDGPARQDAERDGPAPMPERLRAAIARLPQVQQAKRQAEAARREAEQLQAKLKVEEQLRQISQLNPEVRSLADLARQPNYKELYRLVQKGNTLTDAYKLANYDALVQSAAAASRQAAVNAAVGKNHLQQTTTRGAGAAQVPAEVRELYRAFNPGVTDSEIQAHYAKRKRT
ncbi:MAG: hypothetical protein LUE91_02335 [Oscillospiraceae bacterium]|nr:hypothetical protein [Oscillospiraceae bacterium]